MPGGCGAGLSLVLIGLVGGFESPSVSCGGHSAASCHLCVSEAPQEDAANYCNGDCMWTGSACIERSVSCGSHRAHDCSDCPQGHGGGWCHGDCLWLAEACVPATPENHAAAEKELQQVQSRPRFRSSDSTRSEPEPSPEDLYTMHVRNLVGTTVKAAVEESGKDVLVNCFAPWCGHCQRFKPKYQELAKRLAHVSSLVVSQMDCTQNDLGPLKRIVHGYPTIALFPDGRKDQVQLYVGNRSPEDMTKWLHTKVTHDFSDTPPELAKREGDGLLPDEDDL